MSSSYLAIHYESQRRLYPSELPLLVWSQPGIKEIAVGLLNDLVLGLLNKDKESDQNKTAKTETKTETKTIHPKKTDQKDSARRSPPVESSVCKNVIFSESDDDMFDSEGDEDVSVEKETPRNLPHQPDSQSRKPKRQRFSHSHQDDGNGYVLLNGKNTKNDKKNNKNEKNLKKIKTDPYKLNLDALPHKLGFQLDSDLLTTSLIPLAGRQTRRSYQAATISTKENSRTKLKKKNV
jgi:hypothetical protein